MNWTSTLPLSSPEFAGGVTPPTLLPPPLLPGRFPAGRQPAWEAATAWITALPVTRLAVLRAHRSASSYNPQPPLIVKEMWPGVGR
ncbi:hypothetical protein [Streptomyces sp. NPDC059970]|uniref:hypothetical protein n=1 Tax=Streptomyces sp. NPDC059970 TaxID=3347019 RepID=UPI0036A45115